MQKNNVYKNLIDGIFATKIQSPIQKMSQLEKLLEQFINTPLPKWNEVVTLMKKLGYKRLEGDGSRIKFVNLEKKSVIELHRPHPGNTIKHYVKKDIIKELKDKEFIK